MTVKVVNRINPSKMPDKSLKATLLSVFLTIPFIANANMIWPSVYIVEQYYVWYVILAGLFIEIIAAHFFLKISWKKATFIMFVVNAVSAVLGLLVIPLSGIFIEFLTLPFGGGTFQLSHWILDYLCVVLANAGVEGLALKWIFKFPFKSNFVWLLSANFISVIICVLVTAIKTGFIF